MMFRTGMRFFLVALVVSLGIGCVPSERARHSTFAPTIEGRGFKYYEYMAVADPDYPVDGERAEEVRISWLVEWLKANRIDPSGYEIVSRRPVFRRETEGGKVYDIFYEVRVPKE